VPVGACLTAGAATGVFKPGNHGSTFGGNPLACVAALTTLTVLEEDKLLTRATSLGERLRARLGDRLGGVAGVIDIRGSGLMIGIELDRPCAAVVAAGLVAGILINVTADKVIRLLPPLVMTDAEADELVDQIATLVRRFLAG
jgi:acetylornithine aminotransferase